MIDLVYEQTHIEKTAHGFNIKKRAKRKKVYQIMYVHTYATLYSSRLADTDKVARRTIAVSEKKADGTYDTEYWDARFVGKAKEAIMTMAEKTRIEIQGNVHRGYDKDKGEAFPYVLVTVVDKVDESMTRSVNFD